MELEQSRWFPPEGGGRPTIHLFCFPFVGGSAAIYQPWVRVLPKYIEVLPVELPGRGLRFKEPAFSKMSDLVDAISGPLRARLSAPFAFFGHSMGATVSFEIARHLQERFDLSPAHLFVSGRRGPTVSISKPPTYSLPEAEFIEELQSLKGTPPEIVDNPEVMRLLNPMLRADFELIETYEYRPDHLLSCPISAFGGLDDDLVPRDSLFAWRRETTGPFNMDFLPGGHFFLRSSELVLLRLITAALSRYRPAITPGAVTTA